MSLTRVYARLRRAYCLSAAFTISEGNGDVLSMTLSRHLFRRCIEICFDQSRGATQQPDATPDSASGHHQHTEQDHDRVVVTVLREHREHAEQRDGDAAHEDADRGLEPSFAHVRR